MKGTATLKKALLKMREEILQDIGDNIRTERSSPERDVGDFYDDVDIEKDRQMLHMLSERDRSKLGAIDDALEKIEEGTYGVCEECGEEINKKRLKVLPFARFCIRCQEEIERAGGREELSLEEKMFSKDMSLVDMDSNEE